MAVVQTLIGNVKGPQGATGATGATGPQGEAATVNVGSVSTTAYGNPAQVVNVGTENEAVLNFVIPQGKPGQATTTMGGLTLDTITTSTASFPSPQVGDTGATAFGKIVKWFADGLAAITGKLDAANVVNNLTTTEAGYALDARQGKALNDSLANISKFGVIAIRRHLEGNTLFASNSDTEYTNLRAGRTPMLTIVYWAYSMATAIVDYDVYQLSFQHGTYMHSASDTGGRLTNMGADSTGAFSFRTGTYGGDVTIVSVVYKAS